MELVEGLDEERAAAARGIENAEALELVLPGFPEADQGLALRLVQGVEVVGVGIGQRLARGAAGFRLVLRGAGFEAVFQHAAERLLDDVAGDEGGRVEGAFLLARGSCACGIVAGRAAAVEARRGCVPGR